MSDKERVAKQRELQRGKADEQPAPPPTADEVNAVAPILPVRALATLVHLAESQIADVTEAIASMEGGDVTEEQKQAIDAGARPRRFAASGGQRDADLPHCLQAVVGGAGAFASPIIKPR